MPSTLYPGVLYHLTARSLRTVLEKARMPLTIIIITSNLVHYYERDALQQACFVRFE